MQLCGTLPAMFLAESKRKAADGSTYPYYSLRRAYWDPDEKRNKQETLAGIGREPRLTESEARELAERVSGTLGETVTVDDLREVRRLEIVDDHAE